MTKILNGKLLADTLEVELAAEVSKLPGRKPGLVTILVGDDAPSQVYVQRKGEACRRIGMVSQSLVLPASTTQNELLALIAALNRDPTVDGLIVQLPLPRHIDSQVILCAVDPKKDVDGFHPTNMGLLLTGNPTGFVPSTPLGIWTMMRRFGVVVEGKHVVVMGRSNIVGKPLAVLLMLNHPGGNGTVTVIHSQTQDPAKYTREADILIAGVGQPAHVTADMVKEGAVIIDVGITRVSDSRTKTGYRLQGDVDFDAVLPKVSAITPVPGGVGPMTIAMLLTNTLKAYTMRG